VGDNFSIECAIAGWPKPIISWEKYGDILPEKRHQVVHGTLYLYDIRLDDRGTYICRASTTSSQSDLAYTALLDVSGTIVFSLSLSLSLSPRTTSSSP
jgi:hypothetical protein